MEWAIASTCLESCVLGEECVILSFKKEYAGLRVKRTVICLYAYSIYHNQVHQTI